MEPLTLSTFSVTLERSAALFIAGVAAFLPNLIAGFVILILGLWVARAVKRLTIRGLEGLKLSKGIENTPIQVFLTNSEIKNTVEGIVGGAVYWLIVLFILYTFVSVLGLQTASVILQRILFFVPRIISAVLILLFGTLLAGLVETLVKGAVRSIDAQSSRFLGKIASYTIIIVAIMASINELGIAQQFITTLFTGFIAAVALAVGLAFGLGSKDVVTALMNDWYKRMQKESKE